MSHYTHLSIKELTFIESDYEQGHSGRSIARRLERCPETDLTWFLPRHGYKLAPAGFEKRLKSDKSITIHGKYDDSLTRELVKSVIVHADGAVTVGFIDGREMKVG